MTVDPRADLVAEYLLCAQDVARFLRRHVQILDTSQAEGGAWVPFGLWPAQVGALEAIHASQRTVVLKARQLGMSWLVLGYALWSALFRPVANVLIFSRRDDEAVYLLHERLRGMYLRLPEWLRARSLLVDNDHCLGLSNGSVIRAFPTTGGDSYTATMAIVDEADLVPDLGTLLRSVAPTIDAGGKLVLLSRADKSRPGSEFKRIFAAARSAPSPWRAVFLPWSARPDRTLGWYEAQCADALARTYSLDAVHEQYPASAEEALAPSSLNKRLPASGLLGVYAASTPLPRRSLPPELAACEELRVYALPVSGRRYVVGVDPAEGLPGVDLDDSALCVVDAETGEEVCCGLARWEPKHALPAVIEAVAGAYVGAGVLVERNNHGHATLGALMGRVRLLAGPDGRLGHVQSPASKARLWGAAWGEITARAAARADPLLMGETMPPPLIRDAWTFEQLASLEVATCKAPQGEHDDAADAWGLAQAARLRAPDTTARYEQPRPAAVIDPGGW